MHGRVVRRGLARTKLGDAESRFCDGHFLLIFVTISDAFYELRTLSVVHLHLLYLSLQPTGEDDETRCAAEHIAGLLQAVKTCNVCL